MTGQTQTTSDIGWICPVRRLVNELGIKLIWGNDTITLQDSSGKELLLQRHYGLPFMDWD
eukprot:353165-Prorocentrum_lima.AAC.1